MPVILINVLYSLCSVVVKEIKRKVESCQKDVWLVPKKICAFQTLPHHITFKLSLCFDVV